jgi:hypothetical protein
MISIYSIENPNHAVQVHSVKNKVFMLVYSDISLDIVYALYTACDYILYSQYSVIITVYAQRGHCGLTVEQDKEVANTVESTESWW